MPTLAVFFEMKYKIMTNVKEVYTLVSAPNGENKIFQIIKIELKFIIGVNSPINLVFMNMILKD